MSQQRPRDLLEFLRRTSANDAGDRVDGPTRRIPLPNPAAVPPAADEPKVADSGDVSATAEVPAPARVQSPVPAPHRVSSPHVSVTQGDAPMMVFRRSQVVVAGVAAGLLIVLAYLLGSTWGGESAAEQEVFGAVGVYTIAVVEYYDNAHGQVSAKMMKSDLTKRGWDEVMIEQLDRDRKLWVTIGSWVSNPRTNRDAMSLLSKVKKLRVRGNDKFQFADARFVRIKR
jgi:hypothetical protein